MDDLIYLSTTKLAGLLRARKVSAVEAVESYIARQLAVNDMLNAVVMNSYARARTEAMTSSWSLTSSLSRSVSRARSSAPRHRRSRCKARCSGLEQVPETVEIGPRSHSGTGLVLGQRG